MVSLSLALPTGGAWAQGSDMSSSSLSQSRRGSPQGEASSQSGASVAQVGAGTTSASTTANSGPQQNSAKSPGVINLPPLPNREMCDAFKDTPAHQSCLRVVLRQDGKSQ
jgi:hypothetical protein